MNTRKISILAVDDDPLNLEILSHTLERNGYEVTCVSDGGKALIFLNSMPQSYDLVLLDRMMPIMDGLEVLQRVRENPKLSHIPVVLQSAKSGKDEIDEGIKAGALYYITKPFTQQALLKVVENVLSDLNASQSTPKIEAQTMVEQSDNANFTVQTPDEAGLTALFLANLYPNPEEMLPGIKDLLLNAVIHGNLGIDFDKAAKYQREGKLDREIERCLKMPDNQQKRVKVAFKKHENEFTLIIEDEGIGYSWRSYSQIDPNNAARRYGLGINVGNLACFDDIEYKGSGNIVIARNKR